MMHQCPSGVVVIDYLLEVFQEIVISVVCAWFSLPPRLSLPMFETQQERAGSVCKGASEDDFSSLGALPLTRPDCMARPSERVQLKVGPSA